MLVSDEDREWIDARADQLFRESERSRGGVRPATTLPQDYRDYFVVQAAWERAEKRGAERMREQAAAYVSQNSLTWRFSPPWSGKTFAKEIRALPLTKEHPDAHE